MAYNISLNLPQGWHSETETYTEEGGFIITHLNAYLPNDAQKRDDASIDIYVGDMPADETAEDQAFANYAEVVGFDENDPEDFNPIAKIKFNNKNAYAFDALCEDDSPMRLISQEVRQGVLAIIIFAAVDDRALEELQATLERNLRVK